VLLYWLWLHLLEDLTSGQKRALLEYFHDPEQLYRATESAYRTAVQLQEEGYNALSNKELTKARALAAECSQKRIGIVTIGDSGYPARLRQIPDAPLVLYYRGRLPNWEAYPAIGIVGTRKASGYGLQIAEKMGAQIAACGGMVVSGAADGIDSAAMKEALLQGGPVVGVLGFGADVVYPASSRKLFAQLEEKGCLISEYPPGTPGYKWNFPQRNRLISGISHGVLVVEAPERSGALITARHAMEQGREVFVVPGNINSDTSAGSNNLLREGATAVFEGYDILREYASRFPGQIRKAEPKEIPHIPEKVEDTPTKPAKKPIDNREVSHYSVLNSGINALTEEEKTILSHLTEKIEPADEVIVRSGLPAAKALSILTKLSLKGLVKHHPGKCVSLNK
jgi:DNA processing protein